MMQGAEPFSHDGDDVGVLLCHGFTGTPQALRPWAVHLARSGHSVRLPLLPGHGRTWQELSRTGWEDWYAAVDSAFTELASTCRAVVVGGLSMGGALALQLGERHGDAVSGLLLVNPAVRTDDLRRFAVPTLRRLRASVGAIGNDVSKPGVTELAYDRTPTRALHSMMRGWRRVVADLPLVRQPVLLFRSVVDHVVPASSSAAVLRRISSTDVREVLCERSHHVATLDNDSVMIFERSVEFVTRVTTGALPTTAGGAEEPR